LQKQSDFMEINLSDRIDRDSFEPAYLQLVNILRRQIAAGAFRPGSQLPSEAQLKSKYGVSPMTVRRAINVLIDQGVVSTSQGKGTFVRPLDLRTFTFQLEELQHLFQNKDRTTIKLLQVRLNSADEQTAAKLSIPPGERVIFISRLIFKDDEPVILHREYLVYDPTRPIVESEMEVTTLQGLLMGNGQSDFKKGTFTIHAAILDDGESRLLMVPVASPAFRLEHVFFDFDDREVSWGQFLCPGDHLQFTTRVGLWE
jgi:DNA-binding GntR family transcriptional regulator